MTRITIHVSESASEFAHREAERRGLPDAAAYAAMLLEEQAGANGANASHLGFHDVRTDLADLLASQGVQPISDPAELEADFWPENESADDIVSAIRSWRDGHVGSDPLP